MCLERSATCEPSCRSSPRLETTTNGLNSLRWNHFKSFATPAVRPLAALAQDKREDPFFRHEVTRALGTFSTSEAIEVLTAILKDEGEKPNLRYEAAVALGTTRDRGATDFLLGMRRVRDIYLREGIFWGLGKTSDPRVVPVLTAALGNATEEVGIRKAAAIGLGRSKDPRATRLPARRARKPEPGPARAPVNDGGAGIYVRPCCERAALQGIERRQASVCCGVGIVRAFRPPRLWNRCLRH